MQAEDTDCPVCDATAGSWCDTASGEPHAERVDDAAHLGPGRWIAADLDDDGLPGIVDLDDPGHWM